MTLDTKNAAAIAGKNFGRAPEPVCIKITRRTVANNSPRAVGEVLEVPPEIAKRLITMGKAVLADKTPKGGKGK